MSDRPAPQSRVKRERVNPAAQVGPRSRPSAAVASGVPSRSRPVVLVADDEPTIRRLFVRTLELGGIAALAASSAAEALRIMGEQPVSLLLLDVAMPGMSGYQAVEILRRDETTARIPVILVTASDDHESMVRGLDAGADDFLVKPVSMAELVARVRSHLRSQAAWVREVQDELHSRARVIESLGELALSPDPVDAALAVIGGLGRHVGCEIAVMFEIEGARLEPLATFTSADGIRRGGRPLEDADTRHLLTKARFGPWAESAADPGGSEIAAAFAAPGLAVAAGAPILAGEEIVGLLVMGMRPDGGQSHHATRTKFLAAVIDYAAVLGAVAGGSIVDRRRQASTVARIRKVASARSFYPVFQPIVEIEHGNPIGFEALTRFNDGVPPHVRFAEAAASSVGPELEVATAATALAESASLPPNVFVALNVSPEFVLEGDLLRRLLPTAARPVVVELTEHAAIPDYETLRNGIASLGGDVRIAVDDAGAGYASLRHILEIKPDFAKLDISIIRGIEGDPLRQSLVAGLCHFAAKMECRLIAEGVETDAEARTLRELGVGLAQGHLFGEPRRLGVQIAT